MPKGRNGTMTKASTGTSFSIRLTRVQQWVKDLNRLYRSERPLYELDFSSDGFEWVDCQDFEQSVISFLRKDKDHSILVVYNFTPVPRRNYRIGVTQGSFWEGTAEQRWQLSTAAAARKPGRPGDRSIAHAREIPFALSERAASVVLKRQE